ncbi:methyltransferase domain-containing protein (plasmid) [Legionella lytica]|uniref:Methyltransferase domain-containing protein n=1 Tax=Legionella lytica TaxID=96232 RepID=A0ABY4YCR5_9GAMM|nr:SAM-dependent methyltransferase [Legionella lytica]USQ15414.1 methyltransferase domain-containing protein [Legionella lytica]
MNINAEFFEMMYQNNPDPWRFASNAYELNRYEKICDIVRNQRPHYIFEAGCSIGILTEKLAQIAQFVEAIDISHTAATIAQKRCHALANVKIQCDSLSNYVANPNTDLFILSEIGYYFYPEEWENIIKKILISKTSSFHLLASHWLGTSSDHILSADEVHSIICSLNVFQLKRSVRTKDFRLDYWEKNND